jgi:mannitol-1-phosphate 5-dehydrogenase
MHTNSKLQDPLPHKIVVFGAGKIGRSFIGQLFSRSGFEVVFVDLSGTLMEAINRQRAYRVVIKSEEGEEVLQIGNVRGVPLADQEKVSMELATAGIASFSVGQQGLPGLVPLVAGALVKRREQWGEVPLDFIIAENMRHADRYLADELRKHLPEEYPLEILVGLVETSIGKMVPIMTQKDLEEDPLQVFAEPYNTLIVSRNGFRNPIPPVEQLAPKENIKAWVDRKLFIHNLGHATAAYLGYRKHPGATYMFEVLGDPEIETQTRATMMQSAQVLLSLYPEEFTHQALADHIDDLLHRFRNRALGDTLYRVGSDLYRKLGPSDRMVTPIRTALKTGNPYDLILEALMAAFTFRATDENGRRLPSDEAFLIQAEKGTGQVLREICGLELPPPGITV